MAFAILCLIGGLAQAPGGLRAQEMVDVAIVLAVDTSASVDEQEYSLQMGGIARAITHPDILEAIADGEHGAVAVSLVQWAAAGQQVVVQPWTVIRDAADAAAVAQRIRIAPRIFRYSATGIGDAIDFAIGYFGKLPATPLRRVIDVSGDGKNNHPPLLKVVKDRAIEAGITINGLPILSADGSIHYYYEERVIAGPGAFIEIAFGFVDFADAMLRKLLREIRGLPMISSAEGLTGSE